MVAEDVHVQVQRVPGHRGGDVRCSLQATLPRELGPQDVLGAGWPWSLHGHAGPHHGRVAAVPAQVRTQGEGWAWPGQGPQRGSGASHAEALQLVNQVKVVDADVSLALAVGLLPALRRHLPQDEVGGPRRQEVLVRHARALEIKRGVRVDRRRLVRGGTGGCVCGGVRGWKGGRGTG